MTIDQHQGPIVSIAALPDPGTLGFDHNGQSYFAVLSRGNIRVYRNRCPHRQVRLNWQANEFLDQTGSLLQCATHGALFLIESGECISGPCQGDFLEPVPVRRQGDQLYVLTSP